MLVLLICFSSFTIPLFLLPEEAFKRDISQTTIGVIFSIYSVGTVMISLACSALMVKWGKVKLMHFGFYALAISFFILALSKII
jgi:predicted MFS family arabinose efflux permease